MISLFFYFLIFVCAARMSINAQKRRNRIYAAGNDSGKRLMWAGFLAMLPVIFPACFRYGIAQDYRNYSLIANRLAETSLRDYVMGTATFSSEPFTYLIAHLSVNVLGDNRFFFAIYAVLTWALIGTALLQNRNRISVGVSAFVVLTLLYSASYNIICQVMAAAVVYYGYRFIDEHKPVKYILCVLIAVLFHTSALVMLPIYTVCSRYSREIKNKPIWQWILDGLLLLLPFMIPFGLEAASSIAILSPYLSIYGTEATSVYATMTFRLPVLLLLMLNYKKNVKADPKLKTMYILLYIDVIMLLTIGSMFKWGFRFTYFFLWSYVILCGATVKNQRYRRNRHLITVLLVIWYMIEFISKYYIWGWDGIFPYTTFLF